MEFSLAETRALEMVFVALDFESSTIPLEGDKPSDKFVLSFNINFHQDKPREFAVVFGCTLEVERLRKMNVTYLARFITTSDIDEAFRNSHFVQLNAPAISYPYLRAFVGQMLLLSGYKPIALPTLNFKLLYDQKQAEAKAIAEKSTVSNPQDERKVGP